MRYDEFLATVRERGEYDNQDEAEHITQTVLAVLGARLVSGESSDLAAQLPGPLADYLVERADTDNRASGISEFLAEIATDLAIDSAETARWDTSAVLSTLAEAITGGELNNLLSQLPSSYAELFGHPELS